MLFRRALSISLARATVTTAAAAGAMSSSSASAAAAAPAAPGVSNVVIIGSGPAAHSAAIYAARAGLKPVLYEGMVANGIAAGGQLTQTSDIENFLGFPDGINGLDFTEKFAKQSARFGTVIKPVTVTKVDLSSRPFSVWVEGEEAKAPDALASTLIVATGASPRRLEAAGAEEYWQKGVSTCATCDGYFFKGKVAAVIGGGDSACEEALYLAKLCAKVFLVHRRSTLRASRVMAERALAHPKIEPVWDAVVKEVRGDGKKVTSLLLGDATGAGAPDREIKTSGVFVAIGHVPATVFLGGQLETDAEGYLKVDAAGATSVTGVWAAGDVADRKYRQAIVAAGAGCVAALECERWLTMNEPPSA